MPGVEGGGRSDTREPAGAVRPDRAHVGDGTRAARDRRAGADVNPLPVGLLPDTAQVLTDRARAVGGCRSEEVGTAHGRPVVVYDDEHLRARCREAVAAFGPGRAAYAAKAFMCTAVARLAYEEGMGIDVASGGELHVALRAGVP